MMDKDDRLRHTNSGLTQPRWAGSAMCTGGWESPRFGAVSWLKAGSIKATLSRPAHLRVTQTVGRLSHSLDRCMRRLETTYERAFYT
jgi:hypothetical protein